jgi:hypothetical protein
MKRPARPPDPTSWAELLKRREAERTAGPPLDSYRRLPPILPRPGGIAIEPAPESVPPPGEHIDTTLYRTTKLFDQEEVAVHPPRPRRDHGPDIARWHSQTQQQREDETNAALAKQRLRGFPKVQLESGDFDIVSGVPYEAPFKATVGHIMRKREAAARCQERKRPDPVSHRIPIAALEERRVQNEAARRQNTIDYFQAKMPSNERRAKNTFVNIVTGELKRPDAAAAVNDFPGSNPRKAEIALEREDDIVRRREEERRVQTARIGCRYNNGRMEEIRDWNIVSGAQTQPGWDESVKMKPSLWEWCEIERLESLEDE